MIHAEIMEMIVQKKTFHFVVLPHRLSDTL